VRAFRLIDQERAHHAVSVLCSVLKVTRQGYYAWKRRPPSARRLRDDELKADILALFERSRDTYGAPRIKDRLRIEQGIQIGQKRAARLMRELGIQGTGKGQRRIRTTVPDRCAPAAPDRAGRDFTASRPDEKWVADITYIPTHQGWLFLAAVSDCYSRRIVGWSMRDTLEAKLVADAIAMAIARRQPPPGVIHHSDRGAQYGSLLVGRTLREAAIIPSMGRVGDPWDNALMESAIGTIKAELVNRHVFQTRDQARLAVFDYIEAFYNPIRAHSALGHLSPDEYEAEYHQTPTADNQAA
jgi:transposase InsO family protein